MYDSQGGTAYRGVKMKEDILIPPTGGWSAASLYIAVNPNAEAQKRKREEEVTQENSGVNIRVENPHFQMKLQSCTSTDQCALVAVYSPLDHIVKTLSFSWRSGGAPY